LKINGEEIIPVDTEEIFSLEQAALYFAYNNLKSDIEEINDVITEIEDLRIKEIEIEDVSSEMVNVVKKLVKSYIFFGSSNMKKELDKKTILYNSVLESEYSVSGKYKDYNLFARIDRIDILEEDVMFDIDKRKNELKPAEKFEKTALSIIDYKNSRSFQSEQLLFYYYILLSNPDWEKKMEEKSIFLSFLPMKEKDIGKKDALKWFKIENNHVYIKYAGNSNSYNQISLKEFERWFDEVINAIKNAEFYPVFIDDGSKLKLRFLDYLKMKEYSVQNSAEKYYTCGGGYNPNGKDNKCEYYRLCSILGWGKYINLKNREYLKSQSKSK